MSQRRLPVYLVIDCSESMVGQAIEDVTRGVQTLVNELRQNPDALETAYLSLITFNRYAKQEVPLTEILAFNPPPKLKIRPGTGLGSALQLLTQCIQREVVKTTATTKGDYRPLVFLFTDGQPTDDWKGAADQLKTMHKPSLANIYAIGCGPDVDANNLRRITDIVLQMPDMSSDKWKKVFVWLSASVQSASIAVNASKDEPLGLSSLPKDSLQIAPEHSEYHDPTPRQLFLHGTCGKHRKPYLMRFSRAAYGGGYDAVMAHKLDETNFESGDEQMLPPINSSQLNGCPPCPYCGNDAAAQCPCGAMFCVPMQGVDKATCPKCLSNLGFAAEGGAFDIRRSEG